VSVTLLGGNVQRDSQVTVGPLVRVCAQEFLVDRLFIGADGWADGVGFTNADQMRAEAVRSMAESASEVVVLTESEKFGRRGAVPIRVKKPITVVTDADIPEEARGGIAELGIQLIIA